MSTATLTLNEIESIVGRSCYDHVSDEFGSLDIPVLDGPQAQGDLLVVPVSRTPGAAGRPVAGKGVDVVEAANGGHAHTLVAPDGGCVAVVRESSSADDLVVALIDCVSPVYLFHMEHGATGIAPGRYEIRGQREFDAAEARRVAD